jgi:hypothetical protein
VDSITAADVADLIPTSGSQAPTLHGAEGVYDRCRGAPAAGIFTPTCELDLLRAIGDQHHGAAVALDQANVRLGHFLAVDQQLPNSCRSARKAATCARSAADGLASFM